MRFSRFRRLLHPGEWLLEFTGWEMLYRLEEVVGEIRGALKMGHDRGEIAKGLGEASAGRVLLSVDGLCSQSWRRLPQKKVNAPCEASGSP
jgi:hypothetical protein